MLTLFRKPAPIPPLPLNQPTIPADGSLYRQSQVVWIGKHTFPSVVDLKFGLAIRTDIFTRFGIRDWIETERAFHIGLFWVNSKTFFLEGTCFIWRSSLRASLLVILELTPAISTGIRDLVYLAPFPELWAINRFSISLVIPQ
jgi:hypothetical protein